MFTFFYCSSLLLTISLTSGQPNKSQYVNFTPKRTLEQTIFDPSNQKNENQYFNNVFNIYKKSSIKPENSLSIDSHDVDEPLSSQQNQKTFTHNQVLELSKPIQTNFNKNSFSYQTINHYQTNPNHYSTNYQVNNVINKNENNEENQFNHYDIEPIIHQKNQDDLQRSLKSSIPKQNSYSNGNTQFQSTSTTAEPILRLHNTKVDGKLAPTLVITLPKKRKKNNKSRRFPFLKAIVNSFISADRKTSTPNSINQPNLSVNSLNNQAKILKKTLQVTTSQSTQSQSVLSPVIELSNISNHQQEDQKNSAKIYKQSNVQNTDNQNIRAQKKIFSLPKNKAYSFKLRSQSHLNGNTKIVPIDLKVDNPNNENNMPLNKQISNLPKEETKPNEFDDALFQLPPKDEFDDEEEEFNEHSEAPRPHNFDENQYYIESSKIKYPVSRGPLVNNKNNDYLNQPQISFYNQNNKKQNNKYSNSNSSPDFESMTSEVIDQEENEYSDKRPSISVRSRGSFLISVLSRMMKSVNFTMITEDMRLGSSSRASCLACHALAALYLSPLYSKEAMVNAARTICISFRLQPTRVCTGLIDSFKDDLDYIRTHTKLNRREMCGVIFGLKCSRITTNNLNWIVSIPNRPNMIERRMMKHNNINLINNIDSSESSLSSSNFTNYSVYSQSGSSTSQSSNTIKNTYGSSASSSNNYDTESLNDVVQITDIHVDPYYVPGSNAECGEPLCCRATSGIAKNPSKVAGVWGDYRNCDTPINTLRNTLKQISDSHPNANYWMWTGDIAPHDIWNITKGEIIYQLRLVTNMIKEYSKVPVFPVIGNHEGVPVNSFPPPEVKGDLSVSWLYDEVAKQWSYWLPPEAIKTLRFGGYYMVKIKPGFRIISLNTNYCTRLNPWTLYDPVDPGKQLKWLVKELYNAELAGDKVHILGHIPPDSRECTQAWLNNFLRIIDRFENVVLAQYYGHTHRDEFRVLYSPYGHGLRPISVAYIGPSVTPFTENNPAYRVYSMDDKGYIQDHHTYYFNLTEANLGVLGIPIWRHEYSATQEFPLKNLGPEGWHNLISKFMEDDFLLNKYQKMYFRFSHPRSNHICSEKCRQALLNDLIVAHPLKTKPRRLFGSRKH